LKKNLLIIGGSSYFGKLILNKIDKKKYKVFSTYNQNYLKKRNVNQISLDINNFNIEELKIYPKSINKLIILSWCKLDDYQSKDHSKFCNNLIYFSKSILQYANIDEIVVLGSCLEYGILNGEITEDHKCYPTTLYGKNKIRFYKHLIKLKTKFKFRLNWPRIFYLYGDHRDRGIWSQFMKSKNDKSIFNMSQGNQQLDFLHIKTVIKYLISIILSDYDNGIINLCSGKPIKLIDLVKRWSKRYNVKTNPGFYPYTNYESMAYWGSNKKLKRILKRNV